MHHTQDLVQRLTIDRKLMRRATSRDIRNAILPERDCSRPTLTEHEDGWGEYGSTNVAQRV
jgi:hypothetical protein